jgi:type II secretory pathway component GspD/PulD (secretin)
MLSRIVLSRAILGTIIIATLSGCMRPLKPSVTQQPLPVSKLPTILVDQIVIDRTNAANDMPVRDATLSDRRITVTASNADVREILPAIAAAGGINIVMSPEVQGRVSVRFVDVPVSMALNSVIEQAGLSVGSDKLEAPWKPVVFYTMPVNVNLASAQQIATRFGISERMANLIVESRTAMNTNLNKGW